MAPTTKTQDNSPCPCRMLDSKPLSFDRCCQPYLEAQSSPRTAEALMRSRYSAYAKADIDYLISSWWPSQQSSLDRRAIKNWAEQSQWRGLSVHSTRLGSNTDSEGWVEFSAFWIDGETGDQLQQHRENSHFKRQKDHWYFVEAIEPAAEKPTRNQPCPCGSGKKYKRCCLDLHS